MASSASPSSLSGLLIVAFSRSSRTIAFMYMCCALARAMSLPSSKPYRVRSHCRACLPWMYVVPFSSFSPEPLPVLVCE